MMPAVDPALRKTNGIVNVVYGPSLHTFPYLSVARDFSGVRRDIFECLLDVCS